MTTAAHLGLVNIEAEVAAATMTLTDVQRQVIPRATVQGLNRAITSVRGLAVKLITEDTGIKAKHVREDMRIERANITQASPRAQLITYRRPKAINLIEFVTPSRRTLPTEGKPQFFRRRSKVRKRRGGRRVSVAADYKWPGVQATAWRTRKTYAGTFIANTTDGPKVMRRSGRNRTRLNMVSGPSAKATMVQPHIDRAMRERASQAFSREFGRALEHQLRRKGL